MAILVLHSSRKDSDLYVFNGVAAADVENGLVDAGERRGWDELGG